MKKNLLLLLISLLVSSPAFACGGGINFFFWQTSLYLLL